MGADFYRGHGWEGEPGTDDGRSWMLARWIDGTSLGQELEAVRRDGGGRAARARIRSAAGRAARAVAELHAAGWAHADRQPDHVLFEGDVTHLIDLACAQGSADVPCYPHRGGLAHTTAPEIAEDHVVPSGQVPRDRLRGILPAGHRLDARRGLQLGLGEQPGQQRRQVIAGRPASVPPALTAGVRCRSPG
ncbi:hypothetical protein LO762_02875 [Actinocorallia sp. API 0066]|uniref:hypothetical protein n=1 Tax=Actinocorallia sp. API 0066 TaxID=2896846 RepID=UPI001E4530D1|nr:hypothetical protein [Actinocorallia sp. API 0066]MCD0448144.1 hypothetical protein [Actinocorallia sp. API 0066]